MNIIKVINGELDIREVKMDEFTIGGEPDKVRNLLWDMGGSNVADFTFDDPSEIFYVDTNNTIHSFKWQQADESEKMLLMFGSFVKA